MVPTQAWIKSFEEHKLSILGSCLIFPLFLTHLARHIVFFNSLHFFVIELKLLGIQPNKIHNKKCIRAGCVLSTAVAICRELCARERGCLPRGWGVCPGGGVSARVVSARGVSVQREGVYPEGGCLPRGCLPREGVSARHPPMDRMTDACKNITLPQLRCGQ